MEAHIHRHHGHSHVRHPGPVASTEPERVVDPVCGMHVVPGTAKGGCVDHGGTTYWFCNPRCAEKFRAEPAKYSTRERHADAPAPPAAPAEPAQQGIEYTCPMHPEVSQMGPGSCPICGMALEPREVSGGPEDTSELRDMTRRFWLGVVLSAPLFLLSMLEMVAPGVVPAVMMGSTGRWLQLALASPVVLWAGWPFFARAWASVVHRSPNMFTLIALGTGAAYLFSVVATLVPGILPHAFGGHGGPPVYFEAAAVITTLALLGQVLELRARSQTSSAIRGLLDLAPKTARRIGTDGREEEVELVKVAAGDRLRVRPGERVPVDGLVLEGASAVDESVGSPGTELEFAL